MNEFGQPFKHPGNLPTEEGRHIWALLSAGSTARLVLIDGRWWAVGPKETDPLLRVDRETIAGWQDWDFIVADYDPPHREPPSVEDDGHGGLVLEVERGDRCYIDKTTTDELRAFFQDAGSCARSSGMRSLRINDTVFGAEDIECLRAYFLGQPVPPRVG